MRGDLFRQVLFRERRAAKSVNAVFPVSSERRIRDAVAGGSMIKAFAVFSDDADVRLIVEENERAELVLLAFIDGREL